MCTCHAGVIQGELRADTYLEPVTYIGDSRCHQDVWKCFTRRSRDQLVVVELVGVTSDQLDLPVAVTNSTAEKTPATITAPVVKGLRLLGEAPGLHSIGHAVVGRALECGLHLVNRDVEPSSEVLQVILPRGRAIGFGRSVGFGRYV